MDLSRTALILTAWRRPEYLRRTLDAWARVDGIGELASIVVTLDWDLATRAEQLDICATASHDLGRVVEVWDGPKNSAEVPGPARNLGAAIDRALLDTPEFLVLGEEDVVPSADVLRFMAWAGERFAEDRQVLTVNAHNNAAPRDANTSWARLAQTFSSLIWGTWPDRWTGVLRPTWDWDFNTGGAMDTGFDWNIRSRVMPRGGYVSVVPDASRSQHIGQYGGSFFRPEDFATSQAASFRPDHGAMDYVLVTD